jgi:hypothetical protein
MRAMPKFVRLWNVQTEEIDACRYVRFELRQGTDKVVVHLPCETAREIARGLNEGANRLWLTATPAAAATHADTGEASV